MKVNEIFGQQLDEITRRDLLKGAIGAGGMGALGTGAYKLVAFDAEATKKFKSKLKDPADLEAYEKLSSEHARYAALSNSNPTYKTLANTKGFQLTRLRQQMADKYGFELNALGVVKEAWVIKNKDGKEKRFKNADSPEALAWKNSSSPKKEKKTLEKYSDAWWDEKHWTGDYKGVMPDKKITDLDLSAGKLAAALKDEMTSEINDYHVMSGGTMKIGNTTVATARVRVTYEFDMKDMGYDDETIANSGNEDGRGLESVYVKVRRDPKKPENIVFAGYSG